MKVLKETTMVWFIWISSCTSLYIFDLMHPFPSGVRKKSIDNEFYPGNASSVNLMLRLHDSLLFQNWNLLFCQVTPNLSWCGGVHDAQQTQSSCFLPLKWEYPTVIVDGFDCFLWLVLKFLCFRVVVICVVTLSFVLACQAENCGFCIHTTINLVNCYMMIWELGSAFHFPLSIYLNSFLICSQITNKTCLSSKLLPCEH